MSNKPTDEELEKMKIEQEADKRKQADEALRASEAYLRTLIRTLPERSIPKNCRCNYLFHARNQCLIWNLLICFQTVAG